MANTKIRDLTEETAPASTDLIVVQDPAGGANSTMRSTIANLFGNAPAISSSGNIASAGNITATGNITASNYVRGDGMPKCCVRLSANQTGIVTGTWTKVELNYKIIDTTDDFDLVTNYRYIPSVEGYYLIVGNVSYLATNITSGNLVYCGLYVNGSINMRSAVHTSSANIITASTSNIYYLSSGNYVELYTYHTMGADCTLVGGVRHTSLIATLLA